MNRVIHVLGLTCVQHATEAQERGLDLVMWAQTLYNWTFGDDNFTPETVMVIITRPVCCAMDDEGREVLARNIEHRMKIRESAKNN